MMSKRIRKSRWSVEFDLPEPIIHVVQSFLTSKQAAQTTLLSKSWRGAWLTRPNLDIDEPDFCRPSNYDNYNEHNPKFLEFAEKTFERYENFNLSIESFRLSMKSLRYRPYGPAANLVRRALKLGPTRLDFEFVDYYSPFPMPDEVFGYENLVSLTAKGCSINPNRDNVCFSRLRFLSFNNVWIERPDTIFRITSSCPLIEKLSLCNVKVIDRRIGECVIVISRLHRLKSLVLKHVVFDTLFLAHLSSNFPSLKDLTLRIGEDLEEILISSPTLELLDFSTGNRLLCDCYTVRKVKLHVPSIRKLTFACISIPDEVSITSNSRGWESRLSLTRAKCLSASWFYRLSNFIDKFKFSRISLLSLQLYDRSIIDQKAGDIRGLPKPEIENVTIHDTQLMRTKGCYALFHGLFQMCHPKVINVRSVRHGTHIINFLAKRLLTIPNDELNDLKEARAQVFDLAAVSMWRDVTLDVTLDSTNPEEDHQWDAESLAELREGTTTTYETDDGSIVIEELDYDSRSIEESYCDSTTVHKFPVIRFQLNWKQCSPLTLAV